MYYIIPSFASFDLFYSIVHFALQKCNEIKSRLFFVTRLNVVNAIELGHSSNILNVLLLDDSKSLDAE